ncbi:AT-rich interactive domain-containing protein 6-like [Actinidia eriantha]|uniref:AT-rich interactive domain-containing protein 6-like n=1 Tax=Actinidia eriantha TaxID=165200 RepID=UPI00258B515E|nr:AT-rich interactive domain-containing protein 6-like [Actinidia eriantha]XP_057469445.1 AT-rich interactive domain-containing protein 6-like [Actinidia eriantha]
MDLSQLEMEDSENEGQELEVDGQIFNRNLVDAKLECQQEDHNLGRKKSNDKKPSDRVPENRDPNENRQLPVELTVKEAHQSEKEGLVNVQAEPDHDAFAATAVAEGHAGTKEVTQNEDMVPNAHLANQLEPVTPNSLVKSSNPETEDDSKETPMNWLDESKLEEDDETGTSKDQAAFMKELENFYREKAMEFKPPRFYGQPLNLLKLWRAVIKLGGYDRVTGFKLWRQVGESFHPPKTCTTVSWTFRIFYEKALLEYERHKSQSGELELAVAALPEPSNVENEANGHQTPGSGRARRDAPSRAMQGLPYQRRCGYVEVGEPIIKDKNFNNMPKREKSLKSIGSVKNKRPTEVEHSMKAARTEIVKQLVTTVVDIGPPVDWVKINVREARDCFEVYALVPGLLREEVRVQSDPAGRLIITGQPEQPDNPWGITAFKKVVSLPARIDPLRTSAVVSLHGRLFVRVPFEQSNL